jgi:hypothetical protein
MKSHVEFFIKHWDNIKLKKKVEYKSLHKFFQILSKVSQMYTWKQNFPKLFQFWSKNEKKTLNIKGFNYWQEEYVINKTT